jgi:hypothetical protein
MPNHHYLIKQLVPSWVKATSRLLLVRYRQGTWRNRSLPHFIIIGAQKSGTSSLYYYLSQHPQLIPSYTKEVHFFDGGLNPTVDNFKKGQAWYRTHFPLKRNIRKHQETFEASPLYIFNPLAPKRISELLPDVKLIAILRNPTERAISHYFHSRRIGREALPLMEALQAEEARLKPVIDKEDYKNDVFIHYSYKSRGLYAEQIKRYLNYFPTGNLLLINSEKFFMEPHATLRGVFHFVGVDTEFTIKDVERRNIGSNRTAVEPELYDYLNDYFRAPNRALYELTGENYDW